LLARRGARDSAVAACDQRAFTRPELDEEATMGSERRAADVVGLSVDDYYEFGTGGDSTFGYFQGGVGVSMPLAFIPAAFGSWQIKTGVNVLHLGGNLRDVNRDRDRTEIIGTVGLAFTY
jgi:hypothetical protein